MSAGPFLLNNVYPEVSLGLRLRHTHAAAAGTEPGSRPVLGKSKGFVAGLRHTHAAVADAVP